MWHCLWLLVHQGWLPFSQVALEESAELLGLSAQAQQLKPTKNSPVELNELVPMQASRAMSNAQRQKWS
jgi:hypothetical protein